MDTPQITPLQLQAWRDFRAAEAICVGLGAWMAEPLQKRLDYIDSLTKKKAIPLNNRLVALSKVGTVSPLLLEKIPLMLQKLLEVIDADAHMDCHQDSDERVLVSPEVLERTRDETRQKIKMMTKEERRERKQQLKRDRQLVKLAIAKLG